MSEPRDRCRPEDVLPGLGVPVNRRLEAIRHAGRPDAAELRPVQPRLGLLSRRLRTKEQDAVTASDGDLDLAVSASGRVRLFRNDGVPGLTNRSVRVRLRGTRSDTWGAGATATLSLGDRALVRQVSLGHGTASQSEPIVHFGVGEADGPFTVEVRWPSGAVSTMQLEAGLHSVVEPRDRR